jgi:6-phospho-beta-glucosidase
MKIAVYGGTAHSTPALWAYLKNDARVQDVEMVLIGRDSSRLDAVVRACRILNDGDCGDSPVGAVYDRAFFPESAKYARSQTPPTEDADVVLIQIRNGGYAARAFDETFPLRYGIPGDEGLGPGGLSAALRNWEPIKSALQQVAAYAPNALVLMMSSPVGILVRAAKEAFPRLRIAGICELPWTTLLQVCSKTGANPAGVRFDYFGVNHLGWLYGIADGCLEISEPAPLKYLRLHLARKQVVEEQFKSAVRRGAELDQLSRAAYQVYRDGTREDIQRALACRAAPWYTHAVGPLMAALGGQHVSATFFLSVQNDGFDVDYSTDDVLEYAHAATGGTLCRIPRRRSVPAEMRVVLSPLIHYERRATRAILTGEPADIESALEEHPWIPDAGTASKLTEEILTYAHPC